MAPRNFDQDAAAWDDNPVRLALAKDVVSAIVGEVRFSRQMHLLDFGCGTGLVTLGLSGLVESVIALDTSRGMLEVLEGKIKKSNFTQVQPFFAEPGSNDLPPGPFHGIVSSMTFHHVQDIASLLKQFHKILLPGGFVAVADLDEEGGRFHENSDGVYHQGFDREKLAQDFASAGFVNIADSTAATVKKPDPTGALNEFSIFLLTARKV